MNLVSPDRASSAEWIRGSLATRSRQSMAWYKVEKLKGQGNANGMNKGIFDFLSLSFRWCLNFGLDIAGIFQCPRR